MKRTRDYIPRHKPVPSPKPSEPVNIAECVNIPIVKDGIYYHSWEFIKFIGKPEDYKNPCSRLMYKLKNGR